MDHSCCGFLLASHLYFFSPVHTTLNKYIHKTLYSNINIQCILFLKFAFSNEDFMQISLERCQVYVYNTSALLRLLAVIISFVFLFLMNLSRNIFFLIEDNGNVKINEGEVLLKSCKIMKKA